MESLSTQINTIVQGSNLSKAQTKSALRLMLDGKATNTQIGGLLTALAVRGETSSEILTVAEIMHNEMNVVQGLEEALDVVGTGGDGYDTINVSTISAIVCASLGVKIAKHGSKAFSSKCGSFDVLEMLGVEIPTTANEATRLFAKHSMVFLFAPYFHPALKKLSAVRRELGIRTLFNFIGPMLNPGNVSYQVFGVSSIRNIKEIGQALLSLGRKRVLIIHSRDGLDEASISAPTDVYDFSNGRPMISFVVMPGKIYAKDAIAGGNVTHNAERLVEILRGDGTEAENEFVALNAGLGLYAASKADSWQNGRQEALEELKSGRAIKILEKIMSR